MYEKLLHVFIAVEARGGWSKMEQRLIAQIQTSGGYYDILSKNFKKNDTSSALRGGLNLS